MYRLGANLITALCRSCRIEIFGREIETLLLEQRKDIIFPCWHRGILYYACHFRGTGAATMISLSGDGELIAGVINHMGLKPFRGSSSRGGGKAMREIARYIKEGHLGGFTPDGPVGPPYISKPGIIQVAALTGSPLVPFGWDAYPSYEFNSWDRFVLPLPFSRIAAVYDSEPMYVPMGLGTDEYEEIRKKFDRRMNILNFQARIYVRSSRYKDPRSIPVPANFMKHMPVRTKSGGQRKLVSQE